MCRSKLASFAPVYQRCFRYYVVSLVFKGGTGESRGGRCAEVIAGGEMAVVAVRVGALETVGRRFN